MSAVPETQKMQVNKQVSNELGRVSGSAAPEAYSHPLPPLQDKFGRTFNYVRIAVTEKCNLRCTYCMPEEGVNFQGKEKILTAEEIIRIINVLAQMGVKKVRYTGGEPTVRKDIVDLVAGAKGTPGVKSVYMTTNGLLLDRYAAEFKKAGLTGLNISLDTLQEDRFLRITRREGLQKTIDSIQHAIDTGLSSVKINNVLMKGFNDDELPAFCELSKDWPVTVRFIEFMPFDAEQIWESGEHFTSAETMVRQIHELYTNVEVASGTKTEHHVFKVPGYAGKIAVIPAFTRSLCVNCTRIRLTADGSIRNCLYSDNEYDVRGIVRDGGTDQDIEAIFRKAFADKHVDGWEAKKNSVQKIDISGLGTRSSMTQIGG